MEQFLVCTDLNNLVRTQILGVNTSYEPNGIQSRSCTETAATRAVQSLDIFSSEFEVAIVPLHYI